MVVVDEERIAPQLYLNGLSGLQQCTGGQRASSKSERSRLTSETNHVINSLSSERRCGGEAVEVIAWRVQANGIAPRVNPCRIEFREYLAQSRQELAALVDLERGKEAEAVRSHNGEQLSASNLRADCFAADLKPVAQTGGVIEPPNSFGERVCAEVGGSMGGARAAPRRSDGVRVVPGF
ncbi:hypothetical protein DEJ33_10200 [Curtobacterium sp. MCPF17_047]|uniref:hypothetical protein n=1 Tax=unclassified Curtobacterium TaxID=257496 RepID=UPI000DA78AA8|nr:MULTISPECIES: hypothetical protein [unclassified Curtobacterium]PZE62843.1 hypothetical protein DEJ24_00775 [Curtobacterium sp. MCPF17_001]PZF65630.1 hypothetical protein DEJ33_10200 [Curtobacterium sp. MCPF17_047]